MKETLPRFKNWVGHSDLISSQLRVMGFVSSLCFFEHPDDWFRGTAIPQEKRANQHGRTTVEV